jgi:ferric-dicitrate binding protein FerR (iron transport regulator)
MNRDYHDALIDQLLREMLGGDRPRDMTARVLAQVKLIDRFRRRNRWLSGLAAAAALALAIGLTMYWPREYPAPYGEGVLVKYGTPLQRGAQVETGETDGGMLKLGGYVDISMSPQTDLTIGGARYQERVFLNEGNLAVNVLKKRGAFDVVVGPATVHVTGTQFDVAVTNEETATERKRKLVVSVGEGGVQVQGVDGTTPVSLTKGEKREFVLSAASRLLPLQRAGAGLLAAAQEGARMGNRGGAINRTVEASAPARGTTGPAVTTRNTATTRPNPVPTRPQTTASGPAGIRLLSTPGSATRYGKLRRAGDLYYLETSEGNCFMFQKGAVAAAHVDWLALPLEQSTRVTWTEGQVTSVIQATTTQPK